MITIQVIKERQWTALDTPAGLDHDELYRSLMDYKKLVYGETSGTRSPCFFNVKKTESHLEVEQKGLFGWLNFGTKEHPFTLVFQPKMMYILDLDNDGDLNKFSHCLFQMKMITESRKNQKDKRKSGKEKGTKKKEQRKGNKKKEQRKSEKEKRKVMSPTSPLVLTPREPHTLQLFADNFSIKGGELGDQREL